MDIGETPPAPKKIRISPDILDLLAAAPATTPFPARVLALALSSDLQNKILSQDGRLTSSTYPHRKTIALTVNDEKELAAEMLRYRHLFTERLLGAPRFKQAVLTVIQNIYLFRNRKIFFGTTTLSAESERQEALLLFSASPPPSSIPMVKTLQHLIIARVWNRIISQSTEQDLLDDNFSALLEVVEKLNTLRNIYVLLTIGLVQKLASQTNPLYKQSVTYEDAIQIGSIGIARAAYRYHPSSGIRFSTFAANWVFREIQRQALNGRLIRISNNTVEGYAKALKNKDSENRRRFSNIIESATSVDQSLCSDYATLTVSEISSQPPSQVSTLEKDQLRYILLKAINQILTGKSGDIIKRRFGLPPYQEREQSILCISEVYQVTRSSIYQLEHAALKKLHLHLRGQLV
ncbi:MAG: sigma-70 family RNA polymerase sigma factor [Pseudomonadota bacterium]